MNKTAAVIATLGIVAPALLFFAWEHASSPRRAALAFILITVTLDMLALGVMIPVLPKLILQFEGGNTASAATLFRTNVLFTLALGVEARDPYTDGHCDRLARYAGDLGCHLKLDPESVTALKRGGKVVVVGVPPMGQEVAVQGAMLSLEEKSLIGSLYGSANMHRDMPRLIDLYMQKRLKLDELISRLEIRAEHIRQRLVAVKHLA